MTNPQVTLRMSNGRIRTTFGLEPFSFKVRTSKGKRQEETLNYTTKL